MNPNAVDVNYEITTLYFDIENNGSTPKEIVCSASFLGGIEDSSQNIAHYAFVSVDAMRAPKSVQNNSGESLLFQIAETRDDYFDPDSGKLEDICRPYLKTSELWSTHNNQRNMVETPLDEAVQLQINKFFDEINCSNRSLSETVYAMKENVLTKKRNFFMSYSGPMSPEQAVNQTEWMLFCTFDLAHKLHLINIAAQRTAEAINSTATRTN